MDYFSPNRYTLNEHQTYGVEGDVKSAMRIYPKGGSQEPTWDQRWGRVGLRNETMIQLSENAKKEVQRLLEQQNKPGLFLRVGVKGGGCSGLTYDFKLDDQPKEYDRAFDFNGIKVVCDSKSLVYLDGMTIDHSSELVGGGFKFVNPNATGSCGCGTSFSV